MIVYHGSTLEVANPDVKHSFRNLDFGKGFYVTTVREQAERWARRKADLVGKGTATVSVYEFTEDTSEFCRKSFSEDLNAWIDFVCDCRDGNEKYRKYDIIKGKVANDKVYRVVDMYKSGIWDKERALKEISVYPTYDQIAFISQKALDEILHFKESYEVSV